MTFNAESLPVLAIPEQPLVAFVRNDVINNRRRLSFALLTDRVFLLREK